MTPRRWVPLIVMALLAAAPVPAHACPVCFDQRDKPRVAFFVTTVFLSALPLGMAGGFVLWLKRRSAAVDGLPVELAPPPINGQGSLE